MKSMSADRLHRIALMGLRLALAAAFLSSVAGRLGLWGAYGSGWAGFVKYTGSVNWYLPAAAIPAIAVTATILETTFGLMLLAGWQVRRAATGSAVLLTLFALAMFSGNPKSPFDYSVFTAAFGALCLATQPGEESGEAKL
jgi:putative oxidoreductase